MTYSVFDPLNDELVRQSELILAVLERFDPAVRMTIAEVFTEGLLEDVRITIGLSVEPTPMIQGPMR